MNAADRVNKHRTMRFRLKLSAAMMFLVSSLTVLGLYLAQQNVAADAQRFLQQNFQSEISSLNRLRGLRHAALVERCRELVSKPRIHAALEDNALDLLYPTAKDELRDLIKGGQWSEQGEAGSLQAEFYRFLDASGAVLPPPNADNVGDLPSGAEARLSLKTLPQTPQTGYLSENPTEVSSKVEEIVAVPIFSSETGDVISALLVGFKPFELAGRGGKGICSGIWVNGQLHLPPLEKSAQASLSTELTRVLASSAQTQSSFTVTINGGPHLLFYRRLNPESVFPAAYEICIYPLADYLSQVRRLRWKIGGTGVLVLFGGFVASHFVAARLSVPVEKLAVESEEDRAQRERAEAALATTAEELKRSSQYSADASHQLKSPVTVFRAGLETLLGRDDLKPEVYEELSALLHQTHRLTSVIDDLLLLSRMDAGHLRIASDSVNLSQLVEEWLDDLAALPDPLAVKIERNIPTELWVAGERRYTSLIVQNLLENARKYNRLVGRILVAARDNLDQVVLTVGNTGRPIAHIAQEHIFERFHYRADPSGHGLGLNLARDLARLHGGDLKLVSSDNDWTEFELRLPRSPARQKRDTAVG
jgi:signal transduction histidine kinase